MTLSVSDARARALFCSHVQPSDRPDQVQVDEAIAAAIRAIGSRGCACRVAAEFGDHPDTAVTRMAWARQTVAATHSRRTR